MAARRQEKQLESRKAVKKKTLHYRTASKSNVKRCSPPSRPDSLSSICILRETHLNRVPVAAQRHPVCLIRRAARVLWNWSVLREGERWREGVREGVCVGNEDARKALQVPLSSQIKAMFCTLSKKKRNKTRKGVRQFKWQMRLPLSHSLFPFHPLLISATFKCLSNVNENVRLQEMPHAALSGNGNLIMASATLCADKC